MVPRTHIHKPSRLSAMGLFLAAMAISAPAHAAPPINVTTTAGTAIITNPNAATTLITQGSEKAVYRSTNLNAPAGYTLQAVTPDTNALSLFVVSGGPTTFSGNLLSNGKVWIINPNGMLFNGATVTASGLLLSAAGIANPETDGFFTNNTSHFAFDQPGSPTASITINNSTLTAIGTPSQGGDMLIQAPQITVNNSALTGSRGSAALLAGNTFTADFYGDGLINFQVITSPISAQVPAATSSIDVTNNSSISAGRVTVGAVINQDDVLDHVINLGGQFEVGTYNKPTNPQNVTITPDPFVYETIIPAPVAAAVAVPTNITAEIHPLTRVVASLSDESVKTPVVNPIVSNDTYERPYPVSIQASLSSGALTLLAPSAGGNAPANPTNLGNLSPAAGGNNVANAADLGNLSPSAGPAAKSTSCANSYLDNAWISDPGLQGCPN